MQESEGSSKIADILLWEWVKGWIEENPLNSKKI